MTAISDLPTQPDAERFLGTAGPRWVFKHSNACPVSFAAHDEVEAFLAAHPEAALARVVVQEARPVSNWLAQRLGYVHQSPQLFLVDGGQVRWHASHWGITRDAMERAAGVAP